MIIDDTVVRKYLAGEPSSGYSDTWIYCTVGRGYLFEEPNPEKRIWVSKLHEKIKRQIENYTPQNYEAIKTLFPEFYCVTSDYTILLVVGFPDPYDAMFVSHNGKEYVIFDLIQIGEDSIDDNYSCHRVLTHELIHLCVKNKYPADMTASYIERLDYTAFDEGFAHALTYPEDISSFVFNEAIQERYNTSKAILEKAYFEIDTEKQRNFLITADTGNYWDKFASISGKLYLLKHKYDLRDIYLAGWRGFSKKIIDDSNE